ncbi:MAG: BspA family leucine-rich repeat surface protein [Bacteroidales bacterium]|nr:BspA family leucine-rich repeat surface protein [Bacteroidales bacterium]
MKKITYIFAAAALIALAASCQVEPVHQEIVPEETSETVEQADCIISFAATVGEQPAAPGTRATIDGDMPVWESGDKIALRAFSSDPSMATIPSGRVAGSSVTKLVSSGLASGGSSSATFDFSATGATKNKIDAADFYVAWTLTDPSNDNSFNPVNIYSDNTTIAAESDKAYGFWVYYGWCADGFLAENAQTFGRVQARVAYSQDRSLAFKNVYHLLKFSSHCNDASYAVLTSLDGTTNICDSRVKVIFDSATETISSVVPFGGLPKTSIYLDMENYGGNGTDYYFALMPGYTIPGFTIKIYDSSDNELQTFTYSSNFTTIRNKITTITNFDGRSTLSRKPQLLSGAQFNIAIKTLAAAAEGEPAPANETSDDYNISALAVSLGDSGSYSEEAGVCTKVSADGSLFDIWATYASGTVTLRTAASEMATGPLASCMFCCLHELTSVSLPSSIDFTAVTNAYEMFWGDEKLTAVPALDMPGVTNTAVMFSGCSSLTSLNLSGIKGTVTGVSSMFNGCTKLGSIVFNDDFETHACTNYAYLFNNCTSLRSIVMKGFHIGISAIPFGDRETRLNKSMENVTNCKIYYSELPDGDYTISNCYQLTDLNIGLAKFSTTSNLTWNTGRP